jgi:hypothetical protein
MTYDVTSSASPDSVEARGRTTAQPQEHGGSVVTEWEVNLISGALDDMIVRFKQMVAEAHQRVEQVNELRAEVAVLREQLAELSQLGEQVADLRGWTSRLDLPEAGDPTYN